MTKVILGNDVAQVDGLSGIRYGGNVPGRVFDMLPSDAAAVVKLGGAYVPAGGVTIKGAGYRCGCCQFLGYFPGPCPRRDSRGCGDGQMTREEPRRG